MVDDDELDPMSGQPRYTGPERRGDAYVGLPVWLRAVGVVGFPTVVAGVLIWFGVNYLPKIQTELVTQRIEVEKNRLAVERQANQTEASYRLLQKICAQLAKTDASRDDCFKW